MRCYVAMWSSATESYTKCRFPLDHKRNRHYCVCMSTTNNTIEIDAQTYSYPTGLSVRNHNLEPFTFYRSGPDTYYCDRAARLWLVASPDLQGAAAIYHSGHAGAIGLNQPCAVCGSHNCLPLLDDSAHLLALADELDELDLEPDVTSYTYYRSPRTGQAEDGKRALPAGA